MYSDLCMQLHNYSQSSVTRTDFLATSNLSFSPRQIELEISLSCYVNRPTITLIVLWNVPQPHWIYHGRWVFMHIASRLATSTTNTCLVILNLKFKWASSSPAQSEQGNQSLDQPPAKIQQELWTFIQTTTHKIITGEENGKYDLQGNKKEKQ